MEVMPESSSSIIRFLTQIAAVFRNTALWLRSKNFSVQKTPPLEERNPRETVNRDLNQPQEKLFTPSGCSQASDNQDLTAVEATSTSRFSAQQQAIKKPVVDSESAAIVEPNEEERIHQNSQPASGHNFEGERPIPAKEIKSSTENGGVSPSVGLKAPSQSSKPISKYQPNWEKTRAPTKSKGFVAAENSSTEGSVKTPHAEIVVTFNPGRWGINLAYLLRRHRSMPEEVTVSVGTSLQDLRVIDNEFFEDFPVESAEDILKSGIRIDPVTESGLIVQWVRRGRDLHIFAPRTYIAGFVSVPRTEIGVENVVICTEAIAERVALLLEQTGSQTHQKVEGPGIPNGWICFSNIKPLHAFSDEAADDLLLALSPSIELEIKFDGGVRIERKRWLADAPPVIRIVGEIPKDKSVMIDGNPAIVTESDTCLAEGWNTIGKHRVECAGVTQSYELVEPEETWSWWPAHICDTFSVCGAEVASQSGMVSVALCSEPSWIIGANPGEVDKTMTECREGALVAVSGFNPVWAIPIHAHRRSQGHVVAMIGPPSSPGRDISPESFNNAVASSTISQVNRRHRAREKRQKKTRIELWCSKIRHAGHLRLPTRPGGEEIEKLFREYKRCARQIVRAYK